MADAIAFIKDAAADLDPHTYARTASSLFSSRRLQSILTLSKPLLRVDSRQFDDDPLLSGCINGVLDLCTRSLVDPNSVVTKRLGTAFDANATDLERQVSEFILRGIGLNEPAIASHLDRELSPDFGLPVTAESA